MPRWVLDANEYLFAFGPKVEPASVDLLKRIVERGNPEIFICRTIVQEVVSNLDGRAAKAFFAWLGVAAEMEEDKIIPFDLGYRYETLGFKPADACIAAYAEQVGAEVLVSENRHFLSARTDLSFRVLDASSALRVLRIRTAT